MFPFILKEVSKDLGEISVWIAVFTSVALSKTHSQKSRPTCLKSNWFENRICFLKKMLLIAPVVKTVEW